MLSRIAGTIFALVLASSTTHGQDALGHRQVEVQTPPASVLNLNLAEATPTAPPSTTGPVVQTVPDATPEPWQRPLQLSNTRNENRVEHAWVDLRQTANLDPKGQSAPAWLEAITLVPPPTTAGVEMKTVFRFRVTRPRPELGVLLFRLFFDDMPERRPAITAWDESGSRVLQSGALGSGSEVPNSETTIIPMITTSTIDVEVPGDGRTVRGAYLDWMTSSEVVHPINASFRNLIQEPFATTSALHTPEQDIEEFGTVTATLAAEPIRIGPSVGQGAAFQFGIESQPLLALLSFEVAGPRIEAPPEIFVNGESIGAATLTLPDLADPGYRGENKPLVRAMHFQYTGWVRAQKIVPAGSLKVGTNDVIVVAGAGTPSSAIRATQMQLKYLWEKSDYLIRP